MDFSEVGEIFVAVWVGIPLYKLVLTININFTTEFTKYNYYRGLVKLRRNTHYISSVGLAHRVGNKSYSTLKVTNNLDPNLSEFYQWFVGFSDGESNFQINLGYNTDKTKISKVSFVFRIDLHVDDKDVLDFIRNKLEVGIVTIISDRAVAKFTVTNKEGIYKLISIFYKYNLNTTKYLDYLDFCEAFYLYHGRDKNLSSDGKDLLIGQVVEIKNRMNSQRTGFDMSQTKITITKSWLLGFIEAEGSFFISRTNIEPSFSIELSNVQTYLLESIRDFLIADLGFDKYSVCRLKSPSFNVISVNEQKEKASVILIIKNINVLNNYLVPYFKTLVFNSKKGKDFLDFLLICEAVYKGSHKRENIRALILRLSYTMNSYRLSSSKDERLKEPLSQNEKYIIQNALPTIEHLKDGRLREIDTGRVVIHRSLCVYEVVRSDGEALIFDSLNDTLKILSVGFRTLKRHIDEDSLEN